MSRYDQPGFGVLDQLQAEKQPRSQIERIHRVFTNTNTFISGKNPYTIGTYISAPK